jgi:hypothetical protein
MPAKKCSSVYPTAARSLARESVPSRLLVDGRDAEPDQVGGHPATQHKPAFRSDSTGGTLIDTAANEIRRRRENCSHIYLAPANVLLAPISDATAPSGSPLQLA